jgi:hypothetical protein
MGWKVLLLTEGGSINIITVDSISYSVDSITVTADGSDSDNPSASISFRLSITPRFYASPIKVYLKNELTSEESVITVDAFENNGYLDFTLNKTFSDGETYEVIVKNTSEKLMWTGRFFATVQTDLENYSEVLPFPSGIIKM